MKQRYTFLPKLPKQKHAWHHRGHQKRFFRSIGKHPNNASIPSTINKNASENITIGNVKKQIISTIISYTLSREHRVMINRFPGLLFTSAVRQCARARTIEEYDVTIPVPCVHLTSQCKKENTVLGENGEMSDVCF